MTETVTERKTVKKVVRPENTTLEYEVFLRTHQETYQKVLWAVLSVLFIMLGVYALSGGQNPLL